MAARTRWYALVFDGGSDAPRGPWKSVEAADRALYRWRNTGGWLENNAHRRLVGPFQSRADAVAASIADYTAYGATTIRHV